MSNLNLLKIFRWLDFACIIATFGLVLAGVSFTVALMPFIFWLIFHILGFILIYLSIR